MNEELTTITSKMAHDIKNSIAIIKMLSYTLKENITEQEYQILDEESDKINNIIDDYRQKLENIN